MSNEKSLSYAQSWKLNLRAWNILRKLCPEYFAAKLLHSAAAALSPYVTIWLSAQLLNELSGGRDPEALVRWVVILLASGAALTLLSGALARWAAYETDNLQQLSSRIYMEKMMNLDYADVDRQAVLDLYSQIEQNNRWSGWGIARALWLYEDLITAVMRLLGGVALAVSLFTAQVPQDSALAVLNNPLFAAGIFALLLVIAFASAGSANRGARYWTRYASSATQGNRFFNFYGKISTEAKRAPDLRMYEQQDRVCNVYMAKSNFFEPGSPIAKTAKGPMGLWAGVSNGISAVLTGAVYLFVCLKAWCGAFGVGSVTQYVGAITNLLLGISDLLKNLGLMRSNGAFLQTTFEFLDIPNKMYQGSLTTEKRADRQYAVEFRDVSFRYPGSDQWALRHVNMKFRIGSRLAVVGLNGGGKTTFIKLLCRLYDPTEGQILLNGIDIRKYRYDDYIQIFSVVFQDFKLLALPLGENVAGSAAYDRDLAWDCLKKASFDTRLEHMPHGLDTYLYKDLDLEGVEVSGGETQKIAIARALYKDAPFIILDEPTAALDPIAEAEIYSKFNEIAGDKTAIYISHRLSSCKFCDEIAVFDSGKVVQQGTHESLVTDEGGLYYALWHAQAQYYTESA